MDEPLKASEERCKLLFEFKVSQYVGLISQKIIITASIHLHSYLTINHP